MNKTMLIALALLLLGPQALVAQEKKEKPKQITPLLFEVSGKPKHKLTLFGTFHMGISANRLPPLVWSRLKAAKVMVGEADTSKIDNIELQKMVELPAGKSLDGLLGAETFARLVKLLPAVPAERLKQLHPFLASTLITMSWLPKVEKTIDAEVIARAKKAGQGIRYLETWKDQFEALLTPSLETWTKTLSETVGDPTKQKKQMAKFKAAYEKGDADTLRKMTFENDEAKKHPSMNEAIFVKRNKAWVPKLEKLMTEADCFVAVGAGHLVGKSGLVDLLRAKGYTVTRITK